MSPLRTAREWLVTQRKSPWEYRQSMLVSMIWQARLTWSMTHSVLLTALAANPTCVRQPQPELLRRFLFFNFASSFLLEALGGLVLSSVAMCLCVSLGSMQVTRRGLQGCVWCVCKPGSLHRARRTVKRTTRRRVQKETTSKTGGGYRV